MVAEERVRIEIAFDGGQIMGANVDLRRLVELAQQGDREALEALYLLHFDRIYSYLHMSVGNRHDAEDLTTQTFLKMLEAIGRFRWQSAPFSAWLAARACSS